MKSYTRGIAAVLVAFAVAACEEGTGPADEFDVALDEDAAVVAADAEVVTWFVQRRGGDRYQSK